MISPDASKPPLSQPVSDLIYSTFPPDEHAAVSELVRSFHWAPGPAVDERVHLDLLEMSAGNLERLRELVATAHVNWRDIILAAEFDVIGDQIVQNERGKRRLEELAAHKLKPNP
jgi:hypothetical protein